MADAEKEKAEKLAVAKKKFEQLKKAKAKKDKNVKAPALEPAEELSPPPVENEGSAPIEEVVPPAGLSEEAPSKHNRRNPSVSEQSRIRSSSFLRGQLSPTTDSAASEIYRKQALQISSLEKELKSAQTELEESEQRVSKLRAGEEGHDDLLDELGREKAESKKWREKAEAAEKLASENDDLKKDVMALERQRDQLLKESKKGPIGATSPTGELDRELRSKDNAIEAMEMEISRLRRAAEGHVQTKGAQDESISLLQASLRTATDKATAFQTELSDLKKNLERTSERAVKEGSQRSSAETNMRSLTGELDKARDNVKQLEAANTNAEEKIRTLTTLHRESESRATDASRAKTRAEREVAELKARLATLETEVSRLQAREQKVRLANSSGGGVDEAALDELEDEERMRLKNRVRDLERQLGLAVESRDNVMEVESQYTDIDLSALSPRITRKTSIVNGGAEEDAFRKREDAEKKRIERVRELKRSLKEWEGWRVDLVDRPTIWNGIWGGAFDV